MHRNLITICSIVLLCGFFLLTGCEQQEESPAKPVVVRKKIAPVKKGPLSVKPETAAVKQVVSSEKGPAQPTLPTPPAGKGEVPPESPVAPHGTEAVSPKDPASRTRTGAVPPESPGAAPVSPKPAAGKPRTGTPAPGSPLAADSVSEAAVKAPPSAGAAVVPVEAGDYDPEGRIDPFAPLFKPTPVKETVGIERKLKKRRALTPLEKLDLSQMKLVGVIRMASGNKALVEESSGKGYVVTRGMYMGRNSGVVKEILKDRVIIEEEIEGFTGKISIEKRELKMEKPVGEF